ncbi:MAG TPA: hypothetical protein VFQ23_16170 [Anaerolineales bacterium]|nr:hypothetical protein [Anaerolineales bacterium]
MRALSNLVNFSLIIITFSLIALGASMVAIPQLLGKIDELIAINDDLENQIAILIAEKEDQNRKLVEAQSILFNQGILIKQLENELNNALAKHRELQVEIRMLQIQIDGMTIAQKAAPTLQILSLGILLVANRIKKAPTLSVNARGLQDKNTVTVRMTREQVKEYSRWRRTEKSKS